MTCLASLHFRLAWENRENITIRYAHIAAAGKWAHQALALNPDNARPSNCGKTSHRIDAMPG